MGTRNEEEPKVYRISTIIDIAKMPPEHIESFLENLAPHLIMGKAIAAAADRPIEEVLANHIEWVCDGKASSTFHDSDGKAIIEVDLRPRC